MYRDELICDLWEIYHVTDHESLPMRKLAILAWGLPINSRVNEKVAGMVETPHTGMMTVYIFDALNRILGAMAGAEPKQVAPLYMQQTEKASDGFESGADFEKAREEIIKRHGKRL